MTINRRKTTLVALQLSLLSLTGLNFKVFVVDARSNSRIRSRIINYSSNHDINININMIPVHVNQQLHTQHRYQQHHQHQHQHQHQLQCSSPTIKILEQLRGGETIATSTTATVNSLLQALDVFGTIVFAFSGALKAGKKGMDIIGMMIIASITAVGGGTLRDVLMMGHHHIDSSSSSLSSWSSSSSFDPVVFWMRTPLYIEISCITAVLTYYFWPKISKRFGFEDDTAHFICTSDALGLAAFCVVGVQQAVKRGLAPTLCVVSGLMTATFGGIIRDVICGEQPRIMYPHRTLYALGPALGAFVYTILDRSRSSSSRIIMLNSSSITVISFLVAFFVRVLSFNKPWRMPHWNVIIKEGKEEEQQHKFQD